MLRSQEDRVALGWLTNDLRSGLANCMPVEALEAALPDFEFSPMQPGVIAEARPCPPA